MDSSNPQMDKNSLFQVLPALEDIFLVINNRFEDIEKRLSIIEKMAFYNEEFVQLIRGEQSDQFQKFQKDYNIISDLTEKLQKKCDKQQKYIKNLCKIQENSEIQSQINVLEKELKLNIEQNRSYLETEINSIDQRVESAVKVKRFYKEEIQSDLNSLKDTLCQVIDLVIKKGNNDDIVSDSLLYLQNSYRKNNLYKGQQQQEGSDFKAKQKILKKLQKRQIKEELEMQYQQQQQQQQMENKHNLQHQQQEYDSKRSYQSKNYYIKN